MLTLTPELRAHIERVEQILHTHHAYAPVIPVSYLRTTPHVFDFTERNPETARIDLRDTEGFNDFIAHTLTRAGSMWGVGGYGEDRAVYRVSPLFVRAGEEPRSAHLAVDIWLPEGTPLYAPLEGAVHSFRDNNNFGDYGPTIILAHTVEGVRFFTLYGHLSRSSLTGLREGKAIEAGAQIATLGASAENGNWPPHLHFQVIADLSGAHGDFPGVARPSDRAYYLALCPDPNAILQIPALR